MKLKAEYNLLLDKIEHEGNDGGRDCELATFTPKMYLYNIFILALGIRHNTHFREVGDVFIHFLSIPLSCIRFGFFATCS
jgi:hypothetical protein